MTTKTLIDYFKKDMIPALDVETNTDLVICVTANPEILDITQEPENNRVRFTFEYTVRTHKTGHEIDSKQKAYAYLPIDEMQ